MYYCVMFYIIYNVVVMMFVCCYVKYVFVLQCFVLSVV